MSTIFCSRFQGFRKKQTNDEHQTIHARKDFASNTSSSAASEVNDDLAFIRVERTPIIASSQQLLRIHGVGEDFTLHVNESLPTTNSGNEVLIQIRVIGLNPIDWKAPKFGWGLPSLPCVLGRDFVGVVVQAPIAQTNTTLRQDPELRIGDVVGAISTDYRDYRKAAFQQYAVASVHNIYRIPTQLASSQDQLAGIGVAFVTAALTLGISLGAQLARPSTPKSPLDLVRLIRNRPVQSLPEDVRDECFSISDHERLQPGQWLAIWGGGTSVGFILAQLAKLAGIKVICIADAVKSGRRLVDIGVDLLVHRHDTAAAVKIISSVTKDRGIYHAADVVGKDSAALLQSLLRGDSGRRSHLACIVGSPKEKSEHVVHHKVPLKLFHEVPELGGSLMHLLEDLLSSGKLLLPDTYVSRDTGLCAVPSALKLLEGGRFEGQRVVVPI